MRDTDILAPYDKKRDLINLYSALFICSLEVCPFYLQVVGSSTSRECTPQGSTHVALDHQTYCALDQHTEAQLEKYPPSYHSDLFMFFLL